MRLVKVDAISLQPGMFVAELDRPWLETPFSLQGFVVQDSGQVLYISDYVDHVFVDAEYNDSSKFMSLAVKPTVQGLGDSLQLKADFQQAKVSFQNAADTQLSSFMAE